MKAETAAEKISFLHCRDYSDEEFLDMFEVYHNELCQYFVNITDKEYDREVIREQLLYCRCTDNSPVECNYIYVGEERAGFILTQKITRFEFESQPTYPPAVYVAEFYIDPKYRRQGIGRKAIKQLTDNCDVDIFMYILWRNIYAEQFWMNTFAKLGWDRVKRPEIHGEIDCGLYVFRKRAREKSE